MVDLAQQPLRPAECPWLGLHAYGPDDATAFFGRTRVVRQLDRLLERHRFVAVVGASGSGKSSLAAAGLATVGWQPHVVRAGSAALSDVESYVASLDPAASRPVLVLDGLEALFREARFDDREAVFDRLLDLALSPSDGAHLAVVCVIRSDSYGECAAHARLSDAIAAGHLLLGEPSQDELRNMVLEPSAALGVTVDDDLVEELVDDLRGEPGALPLLSHALTETWALGSGTLLTLDEYRAVGGARGSIARAAERLWDGMAADEREGVRRIMVDLADPASPSLDVGRRRPVVDPASTNTAARSDLVARLVAGRIITIDGGWIRMSHEAVFREWPRLREWLEHDRVAIRTVALLADQAEAWQAEGRPAGSLLRGVRLAAAVDLVADRPDRVDAPTIEFVSASEQQQVVDEQAAEQLLIRERRRSRILRSALVGTGVALVVALLAAAIALNQRAQANSAQRDARLDALVSRSLAVRPAQRDLAMLLALEADRLSDGDSRGRTAMLGALTFDIGYLGVSAAPRAVSSVTGGYLPDGRLLIANDGTHLQVGDMDELTEAAVAAPPLEGSLLGEELVLSADGTRAVVVTEHADGSSVVAVFDTTSSEWWEPLVVPYQSVNTALNADGSRLAVAGGPEGGTLVYEVGPAPMPELIGEVVGVPRPDDSFTFYTAAAAFLPSGELVIGYEAPQAKVVDASSLDELATLEVPAFSFNRSLAVVDDGHWLLGVGSLDVGNVSLFDMVESRVQWALGIDDLGVTGCAQQAADVARGRLYCADYFGKVVVRDLLTGGRRGDELVSQVGRVGKLDVSPDGSTLAVFGADQPLIARWRIDGAGPLTRRLAAGETIEQFSPDGQLALTSVIDPTRQAGLDNRVRNMVTDEVIDELDDFETTRWSGRAHELLAVAAAGDGWRMVKYDVDSGTTLDDFEISLAEWPERVFVFDDIVVTGSADGVYQVHDATNGATVSPPLTLSPDLITVDVTPDHLRLITLGSAGASLIDIASGELVKGPLPAPNYGVVLPDGSLVGADAGGAVAVYDATTLEFVRPLARTGGLVQDIRADRAGTVLVTKGGDRTVTLYDWPSGDTVGDPYVIPVEDESFTQIAPDGRSLAIGGSSDGVAIWSLEPQLWREQLCGLAGRNLTPAEWEAELGWSGPYRSTCPQYPAGDDPAATFGGLWASTAVESTAWQAPAALADQPVEFELRLRDGWFALHTKNGPRYELASGQFELADGSATLVDGDGNSATFTVERDGLGIRFTLEAGSNSISSLLVAAGTLRAG